MKKHLIAFGILGIFFAGFSSAQTQEWTPKFTAATTLEECKNGTKDSTETGVWINVPLTGSTKVGKCLATGESTKKEKFAGSCDTFDFDITKMGTDAEGNYLNGFEVRPENGRYVIAKDNEIECDKKGNCKLPDGYDIEIKCYQDDTFKNLVKDDSVKEHCLVKESDLQIKAIDYPRENNPEWYCPYSWTGVYQENPYKTDDGSYFQSKLKDVYSYIPEESELMKDCAKRMYGVSKACENRTNKNIESREKIERIRGDYYDKKKEELWKKIIKGSGDNQKTKWSYVNGMKFTEIDNYKVNDDDPPEKKAAIADVKKWDGFSKQNKKSITLSTYVREEARNSWRGDENANPPIKGVSVEDVKTVLGTDYVFPEKWTGDKAKNVYSTLLKEARAKEASASMIAKYISRRNMDINISVSVDQTSHIKVEKLLRVSQNSDESKLAIFNNDDTHINILDKIIRLAVRTMGTLAVLILIISGVLMVISQGDTNQLEKAKSAFLYTLIGLVIGFLSYTIVRFIIDTLLS